MPFSNLDDLNADMSRIHRWDSPLLETVLKQAAEQDQVAVASLDQRLSHHKQHIIKQLPLYIEILTQLLRKESTDADRKIEFLFSYHVFSTDSRYQLLSHFYQLHYVSDQGYVTATQFLLDIFNKLEKSCELNEIEHGYQDIKRLYQDKLDRQQKIHLQKRVERCIQQDMPEKLQQLLRETQLSVDAKLEYYHFGIVSMVPLICIAAQHGCLKIVQFLIAERANLQAEDDQHSLNALTKCCVIYDKSDQIERNNRLKIASILIQGGINIHAFKTENRSALSIATLFGFAQMKALLFEHGARPEHQLVKTFFDSDYFAPYLRVPTMAPK
ncbi:MAG: hypothetical protein NTW08_00180 [Gammaproteobacteria bacterium]|nr:hypothetical protein [Gammaproteobacteria bacterium]